MSKWIVQYVLFGRGWIAIEPDAFDREHELWKANRTPPSWI